MEKESILNKDESVEKNTYTQFVNEECGDTLWDEVLKEKEALDTEILNILE